MTSMAETLVSALSADQKASISDFLRDAQIRRSGKVHILITGRAGHGKDTIGDYLIERYGYECLSVSDGIRQEITGAYKRAPEPVTDAWQNERHLKNVDQARLALKFCDSADFVRCALEAFREEDRTVFLTLAQTAQNCAGTPAARAIASLLDSDNLSLDMRMALPRSPRRIQQVWGTEYRREQDPDYWVKYAEQNTDFSSPKVLTSTRYPNELDMGDRIGGIRFHVERPDHSEAAQHITEVMLPLRERDVVIHNDGTLAQLYEKVDALMHELMALTPIRKLHGAAAP